MNPPLGRLERVDLREAWQSESSDFTPWLSLPENLSALSDVLGMQLEVVAREERVGLFRADLVCADAGRSSVRVLIENQLEATDHGHLGQLLTYAAGLEAVSIVWIASRIHEEHRAALDWLNRMTGDGVDFFGLEIELWRIGDSPAAPKFNVVVRPNNWSESVREVISPDSLSPSEAFYLSYWTALGEYARSKSLDLRFRPAKYYGFNLGTGRTGVYLQIEAAKRDRKAWVGVYVGGENRDARWAALLAKRSELESAAGEPMDWQRRPDSRSDWFGATLTDVPFDDPNDWKHQHERLARIAVGILPVVRQVMASVP